MKKIRELLFIFVFIISIFDCSKKEGGKMITGTADLMHLKALALMGQRKFELANKEMADKILECINSKDIDGLYELVSEEVKNSDIDLKEQIKNLFSVVEGELKGSRKDSAKYFWTGTYESRSDGKYSIAFDTTYIVNDEKYSFLLEYFFTPKNEYIPKEEGIRRIELIREHDREKYYLCSEYSVEVDMGIYVPEEYYKNKDD